MRTRTLIIIVTVIAAVLLAACAPQAAPAAATEANAATEAPAATETSAAPAAAAETPAGCLGDPAKMVADLNCREIRIAVENAYLPFNYISLNNDQPGGWDYDTFNELCARLNCTPIFVEASWDTMIQSVSDGQYDVAGDGITITPDRAKIVDFSNGYIQIQQRLMVRKGESRFDGIEAFVANPDLLLGTQINTTNYETAVGYLPEARIKGFEQMPFAIQALLSEDVDAVIIDAVVGLGYQGENADVLDFVGSSISSDELGFAFPKGSDLVAPIN
ncbi:MAG: amino acid ABC transporter substrate-binding protein, partial [Anaerolineaceae bacterium]|nr:amino acid ABC transporter substrate-binding protein [Anaerolineaceae bacterium]